MPKVGTIYNFLIACPSDVADKLNIIEEAVKQFNKTIGENNNIVLQIKHWSTDSYPEIGEEPQELLNHQVVDKCDGAIALFWTKFGNPTKSYQSGTEEEIERMILNGKQVFLYFLEIPPALSNFDTRQYDKVCAFKEKYKSKGLYYIITSEDDLKTKLFNHLSSYFLNKVMKQDNNIGSNEVQVGVLALNSGDIDRSIMHFENAIKINPDNIGAYLGMIRATFGEQSIPYCKKLELFPKEEIIKYLINHPDMMEDGDNALLSRIIYNTKSFDMIKTVLEAGVNPDSKYALYYAIKELKDPNIVQLLMDFGTDANWEYKWEADWDYENRSALIVSIWEINDLEIAKILVKNGANANYISTNRMNESWSVLDIAVRMNNEPMVKLLLLANANPNEEHIYNWGKSISTNILSDAIRWTGNLQIIQLLLESGANPNYTYSYIGEKQKHEYGEYMGSSLSDAIIYTENNEIVKLLLNSGADPKTIFKHSRYSRSYMYEDNGDNCEVPVLDLAICKKNKEIIKSLIEAGATFDDICIVNERSFSLKYRDYKTTYDSDWEIEIGSFIRQYGWHGGNFFKDGHINYSY